MGSLDVGKLVFKHQHTHYPYFGFSVLVTPVFALLWVVVLTNLLWCFLVVCEDSTFPRQ